MEPVTTRAAVAAVGNLAIAQSRAGRSKCSNLAFEQRRREHRIITVAASSIEVVRRCNTAISDS